MLIKIPSHPGHLLEFHEGVSLPVQAASSVLTAWWSVALFEALTVTEQTQFQASYYKSVVVSEYLIRRDFPWLHGVTQ